jgi:hypothetical protein
MAVACLRVFSGDAEARLALAPVTASVTKFADAYLASRWRWPRRYSAIGPLTFALLDSNAEHLDPREMQQLAADLQQKLFGERGEGEISLVMFEGEKTEVLRFAALSDQAFARLLDDEAGGDFVGRLARITAQSVTATQHGEAAAAPARADEEPRSWRPAPAFFEDAEGGSTAWMPIYHLHRQRFVGAVAITREATLPEAALPEGEDACRADLQCLEAALEAMATMPKGYVSLPFSFGALIKPSFRERYMGYIQRLPAALRDCLIASVYGVPRDPVFGALKQIGTFLQPKLAYLDLHIVDPAFRVESVPAGVVDSVTFAIKGRNPRARATSLARFLEGRELYRSKRVAQGVSFIREARELEACQKAKVVFANGPAVARLQDWPSGEFAYPADELPFRDDRGVAGGADGPALTA